MKIVLVFVAFCFSCLTAAQSVWPSVSWNAADNLTPIMNPDGIGELSGLHWNPATNRLYCVQNDGRLRVLQMDNSAMGFTQIASKALSGGPEGITQVNFATNEFYVIDENNYEIQKYTHNATFGSLTLSRHWDLLLSPMQDTGNTGPEGIVFVPDAALLAAGFVSDQTGNQYQSVKGMGGLLFVAHQDGGYVWVFDVNPSVNDDFIFVGKYKTSQTESCDLAFDRSTNHLYILHNTGDNYLESTDLTTTLTEGQRKFVTSNEYYISNPELAANIEGVALMPKCPESDVQGVFLCRDASASDESSQDVLRWFSPFASDGACTPTMGIDSATEKWFSVYPNPGSGSINVDFTTPSKTEITLINSIGQTVLNFTASADTTFDVTSLPPGLYVVVVRRGETRSVVKWLKM